MSAREIVFVTGTRADLGNLASLVATPLANDVRVAHIAGGDDFRRTRLRKHLRDVPLAGLDVAP